MGNVIFELLLGSIMVYIGLGILISALLLPIFGLKGKELSRPSRTWYIILGVVSIILVSLYQFSEAKKIYDPQPLSEITYIGPLSITFSIIYIFVIGYIAAYIACIIIVGILKKQITQYKLKIYLICLAVALLGVICYFAGSKNIDSYFARDRFITTYMVNCFPENAREKNYRLKADIRVNNGNIFSLKDKEIYILKVYFTNGGYLVPQYEDSYNFKDTRKIRIQDQNDKWWDIEIPK